MHTFIAECGKEQAVVKYPDIKDEEFLSGHLQELMGADYSLLDAEWHNQYKLAVQDSSPAVLSALAGKQHRSFAANFSVAKALYDLDLYSPSAYFYKKAFRAAKHAGLKFSAKKQEALSLKLFMDVCMDIGEHEFAADVARDANKAFNEARKFSYSAIAADAISLEFSACVFYYNIVSLAFELENLHGKRYEKRSLESILHLVRIHHHLSAMLEQFYHKDNSLITDSFDLVEDSIDTLESCMNEL